MKKTLILGATTNPARYAYLAAQRLVAAGHPIVNVGVKKGEVAGQPIQPAGEPLSDIHTITLYIGKAIQEQYTGYILATQPKRLIFNPGSENPALEQAAKQAGIEVLHACTLVMLTTRQY